MNIDPLKDFSSLRIPKVPKQTKLRIYVAIAFLGGCIAFLTPISLSLNLTGKIASKGPSTEIKTNLDSIVSYIAEENKLINSGEVLIKFNQPNLKADITITKTELNSWPNCTLVNSAFSSFLVKILLISILVSSFSFLTSAKYPLSCK